MMKKMSLPMVAFLVALIGGCCKKEMETVVVTKHDTTVIVTPSDTKSYFRIDDSTFIIKAAYVSTKNNVFALRINACTDSTLPENQIVIEFNSLPAMSGPLRIAHDPMQKGDIRIFFTGDYSGPYGYMSEIDSVSSAYITLHGNKKMYISITNALLREFIGHATELRRLNAYIEADLP